MCIYDREGNLDAALTCNGSYGFLLIQIPTTPMVAHYKFGSICEVMCSDSDWRKQTEFQTIPTFI